MDSTQGRIPTDWKGEAKITTLTLKELMDRIIPITSEDKREIDLFSLYADTVSRDIVTLTTIFW